MTEEYNVWTDATSPDNAITIWAGNPWSAALQLAEIIGVEIPTRISRTDKLSQVHQIDLLGGKAEFKTILCQSVNVARAMAREIQTKRGR